MAASRMLCAAALLVICVQICWGQSPMFPGQGGGGPFGGGMMANPLLMSMALGGLDWNKLMYMNMMMNGFGGGGGGGPMGMGMLPAFGLMNAFN